MDTPDRIEREILINAPVQRHFKGWIEQLGIRTTRAEQ
jgi:hypothetical protein